MFASPRREIPSSQCSSHCTLQQGMGKHHQDCGGGGEGCSMSSLRCSYKLGITLFLCIWWRARSTFCSQHAKEVNQCREFARVL